jgi:hypothetical protein
MMSVLTLSVLGPSTSRATEPNDPPVGSFTSVSTDGLHSCGVRTDTTIVCWGHDDRGESAAPAGAFQAVSAGNHHSCALKTDATIVCWGDDTYGQSTPPPGRFRSVSAGNIFTCAIREDAALVCWGSIGPPPPGLFGSVSAGGWFACAVRTDGTPACWGSYARYGQQTPPADAFVSVAAADSAALQQACGVRSDMTLACWGDDTYGQATPPAGLFRSVSSGVTFSCAIRIDETLLCWGSPDGRTKPPPGSYRQVSAGNEIGCAVRDDSAVVCWPSSHPEAIAPARAFSLPSPKTCVSRRAFTLHVRKLPGVTFIGAVVAVRGKQVRAVKHDRLSAPINLTGLPKGRYTVSITATTNDGRTVTGTRTYHTCVRRRHSSKPSL